MNDAAYDISHLLEAESAAAAVAYVRAVPAAPATPPRLSLAAAQEAMARELLLAADAHDEWIRQYVQVHGGSVEYGADR